MEKIEKHLQESFEDRIITVKYKGIKHQILPNNDISDDDIRQLIERFNWNLDDYIHFDIDSIEWLYCLVGNIIEKHDFGEDKEIRYGTKHFSPGTKVYCYPGQWGDGYENIYVIGKPRNSFKLIKVIMQRKYITNFRLKKVYNKKVIREMYHDHGWDNRISTKNEIIEFAESLNANIKKMEEKEDIEGN
jgi:hypothetical protein